MIGSLQPALSELIAWGFDSQAIGESSDRPLLPPKRLGGDEDSDDEHPGEDMY
jgi:hypothetical protein